MTTAPPTTLTTTSPSKDFDFARRTQVTNKLRSDLDRYLRNYRTDDRKELTDGEVIIAIGFLVAMHVNRDQTKVQNWLVQIGIAAHDVIAEAMR